MISHRVRSLIDSHCLRRFSLAISKVGVAFVTHPSARYCSHREYRVTLAENAKSRRGFLTKGIIENMRKWDRITRMLSIERDYLGARGRIRSITSALARHRGRRRTVSNVIRALSTGVFLHLVIWEYESASCDIVTLYEAYSHMYFRFRSRAVLTTFTHLYVL